MPRYWVLCVADQAPYDCTVLSCLSGCLSVVIKKKAPNAEKKYL